LDVRQEHEGVGDAQHKVAHLGLVLEGLLLGVTR
jgi:hypothetical protein